MAVIEGHAEHVMDAVAPDLLPSLPRLRAVARPPPPIAVGAVARWSAALLGLELKLRQYERGKVFCDAVVTEGGTEALAHVFARPKRYRRSPSSRPAERWMARIGLAPQQ